MHAEILRLEGDYFLDRGDLEQSRKYLL